MHLKNIFRFLFFPEDSGNRFAKIYYRPNVFTVIRNFPYLIFKNNDFIKSYFRDYKFARFHNAKIIEQNPPIIELLICSTQKDFNFLNLVIHGAIANSMNPIDKITILVPKTQIEMCSSILETFPVETKVIDEDIYLTKNLRNNIKELLPEKYGWVIQQLLILNFTLLSNSKGVLQIDCDTVLTSPVTWLDNLGNQIIYPTSPYYSPYYKVLNLLDNRLCNNDFAFVSHHMLFQPGLLKEIFFKLGINDIEQLFSKVAKICDLTDQSPFCLEYELYAQSLLCFFRSKIVFSNFGNYSYSLNSSFDYREILNWIDTHGKNYKSISFHSYS
jgi:hypothetical protein